MTDAFASIAIDSDGVIAAIPRTIFGGFAEHLGRCIYGGIYDPASPLSDEQGMRTDVLAALREMDLSIIRYPGGNFVSNYQWIDGVGPREARPRRRELAWRSIETNQFGTNEFIDFCRKLNVEPMLAVNLGTAGVREAADYVEYCNAPIGTRFADLRASHGYTDPHQIKYFCLGNEMDGPWQIGQLNAADYAHKAREAGKIIKLQDPSIRTILAGSSGPFMKTFPDWDRACLEIAWEQADFLSLHNYATNWENDTSSFLGYAIEFEKHIDTLAKILREVKQKHGFKNEIFLSQDEWNVWYKNRDADGKWAVAPHLCEESYNLEDALVVAQWMNVFLRKCDVLKTACLAQIVNVIAPLKTRGNELLKEATFHAFVMYSRYARGNSLRANVDVPTTSTRRFGDVPLLDAAATIDPQSRRLAVFLVHRAQTQTLKVDLAFSGSHRPTQVIHGEQIHGLDPKAANTFDRPDVIAPRPMGVMSVQADHVSLKLPPMSISAIVFGC